MIRVALDSTIIEACQLIKQNNVGCLVVEQDGRLSGIVTDRDIALRITWAKPNPETTTVKKIMTSAPVRISVDRDLCHPTAIDASYHVRRVPIVEEEAHKSPIAKSDCII